MQVFTAQRISGERTPAAASASSRNTDPAANTQSRVRHEHSRRFGEALGLLMSRLTNFLCECRVRQRPRQHHAADAKCGENQRCLARVRLLLFEAGFE